MWNLAGRYQGACDSPLSESGIEQAVQCGRILAESCDGVDKWLASPLGRARQTSDLMRSFGSYPPCECDPRLAEVSANAWDGLTLDEIAEDWPGLLDGAGQFDWYFRSPDGESYDAALARVISWLSEQSGTVVAISHGLIGRLIRGAYLRLSKDEALCLPVPQDGIWSMHNGTIDWISTGSG